MARGHACKVEQLENGVVVKIYESVTEAARSVKRAQSTISEAIHKGNKSAGFEWKHHAVVDPDEFWVKHPILEIECSNLGRVRNYRIFKPGENGDGYTQTIINGKMYKIHRLIAETFHENPDDKPTVDHVDRNRLNNNFENLRWATQKEQCNNTCRNIIQK